MSQRDTKMSVLDQVRFYTKFALLGIFSAFQALVFVPLMLHRPRDSRNCLLPCWACRWTSRLFLGLHFDVRGLENIIPPEEGCVIVVNHQSALDVVALAHLWPHVPRGYCIVKKEVFWLFPFGPAAWLWGTVYIDRLNAEKSMATINAIGSSIAEHKSRLLVFPEGTRNAGDSLLPFKKGVFHVALAAKCRVQPVVVSKYHFLDRRRFDSGRAVIEFLPAIPSDNTTVDELVDRTRRVMQAAYTRLSGETGLKARL